MATSGTDISVLNLRKIVDSHGKEQCDKLKYQWAKDIEDSNLLISNIENDTKYISRNKEKVTVMIERLNKELDYYSELGVDIEKTDNLSYRFPEIRRNLDKNYRTLSLYYYKYNFDRNDALYKSNLKSLKNITKKQNEIDKKMGKIDSRIEGLGSIFLNIVLTISITTTMVTVLLNATPRYSLVIVLGCAWLLLSAILFVGSYFKSDDNPKNKMAITVYIILSIITFFSFAYCFYNEDSIITRKDNLNIESYIQ